MDKLARGSGAQSNPGFALDRIDQQTGTNNSYIYDNDGRGVTAYVIDSGVRVSHSEFAPGTGQHTQRVWPAFTAIDDAYGLNDCAGHGTAVASVIGGVTSGVAKAIPMRSYRVLGCDNQGPVSGIIAAVNEVALHYVDETVPRAGIVNMSLGVASGSMALDEAVQDAIDDELTNGQYPLTFVTSLGNDNSGACSSSPGGTVYDAIGVGATDQADARANFSNFGLCLDVFAPGVNVRAASHLSDTGFSYWSGTSFSAPLVAGAAALYLHVHGHLTSPAQVEQFIENNATTNVVTNPGNWLTPNRFLYSRLN